MKQILKSFIESTTISINKDFVCLIGINDKNEQYFRVTPINIRYCNQDIGFATVQKQPSYIVVRFDYKKKDERRYLEVLKYIKNLNIVGMEYEIAKDSIYVIFNFCKDEGFVAKNRFAMLTYQIVRHFLDVHKKPHLNALLAIKSKRKLDNFQKIFFVLQFSNIGTRISMSNSLRTYPYISLDEFDKYKSMTISSVSGIGSKVIDYKVYEKAPNNYKYKLDLLRETKGNILEIYKKVVLK